MKIEILPCGYGLLRCWVLLFKFQIQSSRWSWSPEFLSWDPLNQVFAKPRRIPGSNRRPICRTPTKIYVERPSVGSNS